MEIPYSDDIVKQAANTLPITWDPDALVILSWAAQGLVDPESGTELGVGEIGIVTWCNVAMSQRHTLCESPLAAKVQTWHPASAALTLLEDERPKVLDFLNAIDISGDASTADRISRFVETLFRLPQILQEGTRVKEGVSLFPEFGDASIGLEAFHGLAKGGEHERVVAGVRMQPGEGVDLGGEGDESLIVDLYGVWQIRHGARGVFKKKDFLRVQGVLIPVGRRRRAVRALIDATGAARRAALAARNFSHNLGSHALHHLAMRLNTKTVGPIDPGALASFTAYLAARADLIAMTASGEDYRYGLPVPFRLLLKEFNAQGLLLQYLCRTEGLSVARVVGPDDDADFMVEIVGGLTGAHALFAILENLARNSAKHSRRRVGANTVRLEIRRLGLDEVGSQESQTVHQWLGIFDSEAEAVSEEAVRTLNERLDTAREHLERSQIALQARSPLGLAETLVWADMLSGGRVEPLYIRDGMGRLGFCIAVPEPEKMSIEREGADTLVFANGVKGRRQLLEYREAESRVATSFGSVPAELVARVGLDSAGGRTWNESGVRYLELAAIERGVDEAGAAPGTLLVFTCETLTDVIRTRAEPRALFTGRLRSLLQVFGEGDLAVLSPGGWHPKGRQPNPLDLWNCVSDAIREWGAKNPRIAIFDRHDMFDQTEGERPPPELRVCHHEAYGHQSSSKYLDLLQPYLALESVPFDAALRGLAIAALMQVVVVDERLAALYLDGDFGRADVVPAAARAGVHLLDPRAAVDTWTEDWRHHRARGAFDEQRRLRDGWVSLHSSLGRNVSLNRALKGKEWHDFLGGLAKPASGLPLASVHSGRGGAEARNTLPFLSLTHLKTYGFDSPTKLQLVMPLLRGALSGGA